MAVQGRSRSRLALALVAALAGPGMLALTPVSAEAYSQTERYFDRQQIEQLVAPVALYPDPLLAQMLSAAAYPEEILAAERYIDGRRDLSGLDRHDWDSAVRLVARYPEALDLLARDIEWTEALGIAYINQPDDVSDAIQRWRREAWELGNLRSDARQTVFVEDGYVRIVPTQQDYVYVPSYDPSVVYFDAYQPGYPGYLLYGSRYYIGPWFDRDWDWKRRRICYSDRRHWRNGKPVFDPRFDRVHVDRDRPWRPDGKRFRPPEKPNFPSHYADRKWPTRRDGAKPDDTSRSDRDGDRDRDRDDDRKKSEWQDRKREGDNGRTGWNGRDDRREDGGKPPLPNIRRGSGDDDDDKAAGRSIGKPVDSPAPKPEVKPTRRNETPNRQVEPRPSRQAEPSARRTEQQPSRKEPPQKAAPQPRAEPPPPQPQPAKRSPPPRSTEENQPRGAPDRRR
ncbi:MAG: DUF3300 domain-containing protein [Reyranellaceae bacterium]